VTIVLSEEREVGNRASVVIVVITAGIELGLRIVMMVALAEEGQIGHRDFTGPIQIGCRCLNIKAYDIAATAASDYLALYRYVDTAVPNASAGGDLVGQSRLTIAVGERIRIDDIRTQAKRHRIYTSINPVIRDWNARNAVTGTISDYNLDVMSISPVNMIVTGTYVLKIPRRTDVDSHGAGITTEVAIALAPVNFTSVERGREHKQQREKQHFSFEHLLNLLTHKNRFGNLKK
jgi:hypothetical protein